MTVNRLSLLSITLCLAISGCSTAITATRDTPIQDDRGTRTFGSKIDDSLIETKVEVNVAKAATDLGNGASRIVVTSFNGIVLLAGIITMTPGTLSADLSADRRHLLVHAFNITDEAELIASIKTRYEAPLMEIFN